MKTRVRSVTAVLCIISISFFVLPVSALDLGGKLQNTAKDAGHKGSKMAVQSQINKSLKEKNCSFKPKSTELTCDLEDILSTFNTQRVVAEQSGFSKDVDIHITVGQGSDPKNPSLGSQRMDEIRNKLKKKTNYWDWYDSTEAGDKLTLSVKIQ